MQIANSQNPETKDWYVEDQGQFNTKDIAQTITRYMPDAQEEWYDHNYTCHILNKKRTKNVSISSLRNRYILSPDKILDVINFLKD